MVGLDTSKSQIRDSEARGIHLRKQNIGKACQNPVKNVIGGLSCHLKDTCKHWRFTGWGLVPAHTTSYPTF